MSTAFELTSEATKSLHRISEINIEVLSAQASQLNL